MLCSLSRTAPAQNALTCSPTEPGTGSQKKIHLMAQAIERKEMTMKLRLLAMAILFTVATAGMKADVLVSYSSANESTFVSGFTWVGTQGSLNLPIGGTSQSALLGTFEWSGIPDPLAIVGPGGSSGTGDNTVGYTPSVSLNGELDPTPTSTPEGLFSANYALAINCTSIPCSVDLSGPIAGVTADYSFPDQLLNVSLTVQLESMVFNENPGSQAVYGEFQVTQLPPPKASEPSSAFLAIGPVIFYLIRRRHLRPDRAS